MSTYDNDDDDGGSDDGGGGEGGRGESTTVEISAEVCSSIIVFFFASDEGKEELSACLQGEVLFTSMIKVYDARGLYRKRTNIKIFF